MKCARIVRMDVRAYSCPRTRVFGIIGGRAEVEWWCDPLTVFRVPWEDCVRLFVLTMVLKVLYLLLKI